MNIGLKRRFPGLARRLENGPLEFYVYALFAGVCVLLAACWFYSSMRLQTLYSMAWSDERFPTWVARGIEPSQGPWSAPLDDVFIHFDFARSAARGHPFEWSPGNGYSSGDTSLLYPFALAVGYLLGFHETLMFWAALVACVSIFAALLAARRLFRSLPVWTSYLAPVALLSVGALDWSFFSGMEVAFFLGLWGLAFVLWDKICQSATAMVPVRWSQLGALGISGALLVATRPEAVTTVAVLAVSILWVLRAQLNFVRTLRVLALVAGPGAIIQLGQAFANYIFTGEVSAAGAIAKLELHHPYLSLLQVWDAWKFNLMYEVTRVTNYHFSIVPGVGWLVWLLAAIPLVPTSTRRPALFLWFSLLLWACMVALNGQVRWQNERYVMPAVAWLLLLAALGLGVSLNIGVCGLYQRRWSWVLLGSMAGLAGVAFAVFQAPRFRDQVWFFGRASRNILDQHATVGVALRENLKPRRVLVGDAGAIPYVADVPALDIIGLGGYRKLPFARATRYGVAAAIELIERLPLADRPDLLAIYPSWWGDFPLWFGSEIGEVPLRGNVIAGGASKVVYVPDWSPIETSNRPRQLGPTETVVDSLDFADLVNERTHAYARPLRGQGFVTMKILTYPSNPQQPVWDGGRIASVNESLRFTLSGLTPGKPARILVRTAPTQSEDFKLTLNGKPLETPRFFPADYWREVAVPIPIQLVAPTLSVELHSKSDTISWYHLWLVQ